MIRAFVLLLLTNGLLVFMHYNEAGKVIADGANQAYGQEIEVMNREDGLHIRHHFTGLSDARIEIVWPVASINRACYLEDVDSCSRLNENITALEEGDEKSQSISYVIPTQGSMGTSMLYEDIFASLHNNSVLSTIMHITDEVNLEGLWVNGLEQVGKKQMALVNYSLFKGNGAVTDLYWQQTDPPLRYENEYLTVYGIDSDATIEQFQKMTDALISVEAFHSTIVFDGNNEAVDSTRFIVTNESGFAQAAESFLINHLYDHYALPTDEPWTVELIASLLSGQALGSEITRLAYDQLHKHLTAVQIEQLTAAIRANENDVLTAKLLTELFVEVTGFGTSFFEKNRQATDQLYPFLLKDAKSIFVAGEKRIEQGAIVREGRTLYPVVEIMRALGYDVTWNDQSLYIDSTEKNYRFPLKQKFYVYNERRFDVLSIPFERFEDEFYFEESVFIRIFHIGIEKKDDRIEVNSIPILKEGKS